MLLKCAIAVAQKDGEVIASEVGRNQVQTSVIVQVRRGNSRRVEADGIAGGDIKNFGRRGGGFDVAAGQHKSQCGCQP